MNETEIFAKAIEHNSLSARVEYINQVCAKDDPMRKRLLKLLDAHESPDSFLEQPVAEDLSAEPAETHPITSGENVGNVIENYKLLQQIGEGGMGIVYMAEQTEPIQRRVALKIIKPGMDSRQVIARFEAERQALAMMDHPNIARVLDGGTTPSGRPFFVMELVHGCPITEYCDREKLSTPDRLDLFVSLCRAVQHAHQKGIIHRDLKPNNILIAEYDGHPVPKVIDFGVAKATGSQLTEKTLFTEFGQVIGTLEYMSPEQARLNQLDIDTRSDIYSLGIVLYALLTGETPFDKERLRAVAWDEMLKIIREEPPQRPSMRLSSSQTLEKVANDRGVDAKRLPALVRGDLDWIVMKALEKERNRRYATASEMADDISRHLDQRPISARPPAFLDQAAKFCRRNRFAILVATLLTAFAAIALFLFIRSSNQRRQEVATRGQRIEKAIQQASVALAAAESSPIGAVNQWAKAQAQCDRVRDLIAEGEISAELRTRATDLQTQFDHENENREIAKQIEEVVIHGATNPSLASWTQMEINMRDLFRRHGMDLDELAPDVIAAQIREHRLSARWTDLLELWIATRGQMASLGGPPVTQANMQPWAEALYAADSDPIRTGIRKFYYQGPKTVKFLDELTTGVNLESLSARTLSWLGNCYLIVQATDKADEIYDLGLKLHPTDVMLNFDIALSMESQQRWQEAIRVYHRCLALRPKVAGVWISLGKALEKVGEKEAAQKAQSRADEIQRESTSQAKQ